ncbi:lymphoid enhancer-binding factor 1-like isoform X2 [Thalassophryne amazonica]|uniref:lymphoid enhancer-binding factor 1-like isoform X2 n=1 Tax=Thalassophryne amazonica TaxID=390379 RepID=UPI0014721142|nr:lymphoid enhancer-binding factor 1-like isoform X2 [Thalassophryne amazonica]
MSSFSVFMCSNRNNMQETQQHTVDPSRVFVQRSPNAFAFFAREHRSDVVAGHRVKNSPTVNQILGRKWRAMSMDEQLKYYLMAHSETYTPNCKPPNQPQPQSQ